MCIHAMVKSFPGNPTQKVSEFKKLARETSFSGRILNYQDELQQSQKSRAASSKYTDTGIFSKMAEKVNLFCIL